MTYLFIAVCIMAIIGIPFAAWYEKAKKELNKEITDDYLED